MPEDPPTPEAERIYAQALADLEANELPDVERLCREHPALASELRLLHARRSEARSLLQRLSPSGTSASPGSLAARMRALYGPGVDPDVRLEEERGHEPSTFSTRAVERLATRSGNFGRYRIKEEVARGGQGAILCVWDEDLHRNLAMKVVLGRGALSGHGAPAVDSRTLARFLEEAQVTGQLDHPGVVPVHELGLDDEGRVYFTMKLVKGRDLRQVFDLARSGEEGWNQVRVLGVLLKVCEAMAYAHARGVIHRDLKPSNVMVGRFGEVYVMDWGLARVLGRRDEKDLRVDADLAASTRVESPRREQVSGDGEDPDAPLLTMDGDVVGTPAYMSPEQAQGRLADMGPASDVYSLGTMLYHLLAGHMPYSPPGTRLSNYAVWYQVQSRPPAPLHEEAPDAPVEIVAICEKAMARAVEERYADMSELAEDLRAYLEGHVVRAYETGAVAELRKWVARNRGLAGALLAAFLALVIGLGVTLHLRGESERQRRNVLNLSIFRELADLEARADALWPVEPERIGELEAWLADARRLVGGLDALDGGPGHRASLAALRAAGRPTDPALLERAVETHPRHAELVRVEAELAAREAAASVRRGEGRVASFEPSAEVRELPAMVLNSLAWSLVKPGRDVFGREAEGLALARLARERAGPGDDRAELADTLAWASHANGLDDEAVARSREALEVAEPDRKAPFEAKLRELRAACAAAAERDSLAIGRLRARRDRLHDEVYGELAWSFDDERSAWWHEQLVRLIRQLEALADPDQGLISGSSVEHGWGIERRLSEARRIQSLTLESEAAQRAWREASEAIARHPRYAGLSLAPQTGLLPLGPDPASGLWEFAHVLSGEVPVRGEDGALVLDESSCIVLVLLPGGSFAMGASRAADAEVPDPLAESDESPVHQVTLGPTFVAKHELTQAQWSRFVGANPSFFPEGVSRAGRPVLGSNPVESVSWRQALATLERMDLCLPTEAQWEYAARGATRWPWNTGPDPASLAGQVNLADHSARVEGETWPQIDDAFDDGYVAHAPVGSFPPNPFGLHETLGNVAEWCLDGYASWGYLLSAHVGDGEHRPEGSSLQRVVRGGSMADGPAALRCSFRAHQKPDFAHWSVGVRAARTLRP